jgi:D-sedoheptulose 7-phosphate isomerase
MTSNFDDYIEAFKQALSSISISALNNVSNLLISKLNNQKNIFIAGNGGSASSAEHLSTDLMFGTKIAVNSFNTHCLSSNVSSITAIGNDVNFDSIFSRQILHLGKKGDLLIVISASGNSSNLIHAVAEAKELGIETLGILGFDGGSLLKLVDHSIHIETEIGAYGISEDLHSMVNHMLVNDIKKKLDL